MNLNVDKLLARVAAEQEFRRAHIKAKGTREAQRKAYNEDRAKLATMPEGPEREALQASLAQRKADDRAFMAGLRVVDKPVQDEFAAIQRQLNQAAAALLDRAEAAGVTAEQQAQAEGLI